MTALPDEFLRAIIEWPDDDGPRLVAADWLEEHGHIVKAELIRVQCRIARENTPIHAHRCRCRKCRLRKIEGGILSYNWRTPEMTTKECIDFYKTLVGIGEVDCFGSNVMAGPPDAPTHAYYHPAAFMCRGFVEEIIVSSADWLAHADALTTATPLRRVRLTTILSNDDHYRLYYALPVIGDPRGTSFEELRVPRINENDDGSRCRLMGYPWLAHVQRRVLEAHWPRTAFELPPAPAAESITLTPRTLTAGIRVPDELLADAEATRPFIDHLLHGDPDLGIPQSVIEVRSLVAAAPAHDAASETGRPRPNSRRPEWYDNRNRRGRRR